MKIVGPAIAGVLLVAGLTGCASYSRTERAYAYTAPAGTAYVATPSGSAVVYTTTPAPAYGYTYYSTTPRAYAYTTDGGYYADGVYYPPAAAHTTGTSGDNYYRSRSDYYRNYNGIHGGPERTDGPAMYR